MDDGGELMGGLINGPSFAYRIIALALPGFNFIPVVPVTMEQAFPQVSCNKRQKTITVELAEMNQFMAEPAPVGKKFSAGGIVQVNGPADNDGRTVGPQLPGCHPGYERIFFDMIMHPTSCWAQN